MSDVADWTTDLRAMLKDDVPADALVTMLQSLIPYANSLVEFVSTTLANNVEPASNWREVWRQTSSELIPMDFKLDYAPSAFMTNTSADLSKLRIVTYYDDAAKVGYCVATAFNVPRDKQLTNAFSLIQFYDAQIELKRVSFIADDYTEAIKQGQAWWFEAVQIWKAREVKSDEQ